jgi:hypothetical protein
MHTTKLQPEGYLVTTYEGIIGLQEFFAGRSENIELLEPLKNEGKKMLKLADIIHAEMTETDHPAETKNLLGEMPFDRLAILIEPGNIKKKALVDLIIKGSEAEEHVHLFTDRTEAVNWLLS